MPGHLQPSGWCRTVGVCQPNVDRIPESELEVIAWTRSVWNNQYEMNLISSHLRYFSAGWSGNKCLWNSEVMGWKPCFNPWSNSLMVSIYPDMLSHLHSKHYRADSRFAPSQWETALLCKDVSHRLGTNLKSALHYHCGTEPQPEHIFNIRRPSYQHRESHCENDMAMRRFYFLYHRRWIWPWIKLISKRSVNMAMNKSDLWHIAFRMRTHHECCECKPNE